MTSWDDYRFAAAVARNGSLSRAARELGTHHSTVFRRLAALEDATGVRLFERGADGYMPTAAGAEIFAVLGDVENGILAVERRLAGIEWWAKTPLGVSRDYWRLWLQGASGGCEALAFVDRKTGQRYLQAIYD